MGIVSRLSAVQRAIALTSLVAAFGLGFIAGETSNGSPLPVPPNVPTGDFVIRTIASVVGAIVVVVVAVGVRRGRTSPSRS